MSEDSSFNLVEATRLGIYVPTLFAEIARRFGDDEAWKLINQHGGQVVYISLKPEDTAPRLNVGRNCLEWLCRVYGGSALTIPIWGVSSHTRRLFRIRSLLAAGVPPASVARQSECHERTARRHQYAMRESGLLRPEDGR